MKGLGRRGGDIPEGNEEFSDRGSDERERDEG